jgi:hypothetical protein
MGLSKKLGYYLIAFGALVFFGSILSGNGTLIALFVFLGFAMAVAGIVVVHYSSQKPRLKSKEDLEKLDDIVRERLKDWKAPVTLRDELVKEGYPKGSVWEAIKKTDEFKIYNGKQGLEALAGLMLFGGIFILGLALLGKPIVVETIFEAYIVAGLNLFIGTVLFLWGRTITKENYNSYYMGYVIIAYMTVTELFALSVPATIVRIMILYQMTPGLKIIWKIQKPLQQSLTITQIALCLASLLIVAIEGLFILLIVADYAGVLG